MSLALFLATATERGIRNSIKFGGVIIFLGDNENNFAKKTKQYGFVLSEESRKVVWPESCMCPDCRRLRDIFAKRCNHFEVIDCQLGQGVKMRTRICNSE